METSGSVFIGQMCMPFCKQIKEARASKLTGHALVGNLLGEFCISRDFRVHLIPCFSCHATAAVGVAKGENGRNHSERGCAQESSAVSVRSRG